MSEMGGKPRRTDYGGFREFVSSVVCSITHRSAGMSMKLFVSLLFFALAILAIRGARWAYAGVALWVLLQFPASVGFRLHPKACYMTVNPPLALYSLSNYPHMILFGIFFTVTTLHFRLSSWRSLAWAIGLTVAMGAAMEIAQGLSGTHHCKAIDLIPDFVGALVGLLVVLLGRTIASASLRHGTGVVRGSQTID